LRENLDLKDYLEEKNLVPEMGYIDLKDTYSVFGNMDDEIIDSEEDADE